MTKKIFEAPAPGSWERETTHMAHPLSRWFGAIFPNAMMRGFRQMTSRYGVLLDHLEIALVNGFVYMAPRPVGAPKGAKGPPPKPIFKLLSLLHPEMRRRIRRSKEVFASRIWREDVTRWDTTDKPRIIAKNAALQAIDPASLDMPALAAHLRMLRSALDEAITTHHFYNGACMTPVGDYLVQAAGWTGLSPRELLEPLRGSAAVSAGAIDELRALGIAAAADPVTRTALASNAPASQVLETLRVSAATADEFRAYIDIVAYRVVSGYDVADRYALEMPDMLVRTIQCAATPIVEAGNAGDASAAGLRSLVPAQHQSTFDDLLSEARHVYRIRDERCYLNDALTTGLARRALLEAGRRLAAAGRLADESHGVDLDPDELHTMLTSDGGPSRDEIAARTEWRTGSSIEEAPEILGLPPADPPPAEWLPPHAARMQRAVNIVIGHMFKTSTLPPAAAGARVLRGIAASAGSFEGVCRLVLNPSDFSRVQEHDILLARMTAPSYNVLLPLLGGIITDRGGVLSHPAIVAREYGLPAVVGCNSATRDIPDGARVRVDGNSGEVHILTVPA